MYRDQERPMELCLCASCARAFYNISTYRIVRKDYRQREKEMCTFCNYRMGYDYYIFQKQNMPESRNVQNRTMAETERQEYDVACNGTY